MKSTTTIKRRNDQLQSGYKIIPTIILIILILIFLGSQVYLFIETLLEY
jgi:hypothetical protein